MSPLRPQILSDMHSREFSTSTQEAYLAAIAGIAKHSRRSPDHSRRKRRTNTCCT